MQLAQDADIIAHVMTDQEAGDALQVEPLLDQIEMPMSQFTADGAYDSNPTYEVVARHSSDAAVVISRRSTPMKE